MKMVNVQEAAIQLSTLVDEAARGEPFVIAKDGKPLVKVVPLEEPAADVSKRFGFAKGRFKVPDDFDEMFADEIAESFGIER